MEPMTVNLTNAEAKRLGITAAEARVSVPAPEAQGLRTRRPKRLYLTACHDCAEVFDSMAAETRHLNDTGHHRFNLVLEGG
jgi:hypothetical protein